MPKTHTVNVDNFSSDPVFAIELASSTGLREWKKLVVIVNVLDQSITFNVDTRDKGLSFVSLAEAIEAYNATGD